jgi:hypothetical protein
MPDVLARRIVKEPNVDDAWVSRLVLDRNDDALVGDLPTRGPQNADHVVSPSLPTVPEQLEGFLERDVEEHRYRGLPADSRSGRLVDADEAHEM